MRVCRTLKISKLRNAHNFVPDYMQEDICKRPERHSRPNSWEDSSFLYDDESFFN